MAHVAFSDREMKRAWMDNLEASESTNRNNSQRLLLFYAIECGLKVILMRRKKINLTCDCQEITQAQHNINKLLDDLRASQDLHLPKVIMIKPLSSGTDSPERKLNPGQINQIWRYGGILTHKVDKSQAVSFTDQELEIHLSKISDWIKEEI